jgi:DNA gyrase subunit A
MISPKSSRDTLGVNVMQLKAKQTLYAAELLSDDLFDNADYYRTRTLPAVGCFLRGVDKSRRQESL